MDSDFHYYATGAAALAAGFNTRDATTVANVSQYHDWFDSDYWSFWHIVDAGGKPAKSGKGVAYRYEHPQLSVQKIDWKMSFDYDPNVWNPFHFPPGNLPYKESTPGWREHFASQHVVRETNLAKIDANKLCRPFSKFAHDMLVDTLEKYRQLNTMDAAKLEAAVNSWMAPRVRCPVTDPRRMSLFLLGHRMHILADTWAHQDFSGEANRKINCAGIENRVFARNAQGKPERVNWTGTVWGGQDTDCAAAPAPGTDKTAAGHGQMGHLPDYSWLTFEYPAAWKNGTHVRNNPKEYDQAWRWLSYVMALCTGRKTDLQLPDEVPPDIAKVMTTWHRLSTKELSAIKASEALWAKTDLGKNLPNRWDPKRRKRLGLWDGLAQNRYGYINVVRDSTLHMMETAAAIHYAWCVKWLKANPGYAWKPWAPKT